MIKFITGHRTKIRMKPAAEEGVEMKGLLKRLYRKYCDSDSFLKITFLFETVLVISLVFVSLFATRTFSSILKDKELALGENKRQMLSDFMQREYNRIYSLGNYIHGGDISAIIARISRTEAEAYEYDNISAMQTFFSGIGYADENISDVILISDRGNVYSYSRQATQAVVPSYDFLAEETVQELLRSEKNMLIVYDDPDRYCIQEREPVISFMGKIFDTSFFPSREAVGIYIMNIPLAQIEDTLFSSDVLQGEVFLLNAQDQILYSNHREMCGRQLKEDGMADGQKIYSSRQSLGSSEMSVAYQLSERLLFSQIYRIRDQIIGVLLLAIFVTLLFAWIIYRIFRKKIHVLMASMEELEKGNFEVELPVQSRDEIGRISMQFNEMCRKLNAYVKQVYHSEIQRKNAEINALQTQINPHFLYNTLESIKAEALSNNDTETADMIAILGSLFRWTNRTGEKLTTLDEELDYVRNYLVLQSYRYNHQLEFSMNVREEYLDYAVPKLILQPLVENVIKYGLNNTGDKMIVGIYARKKEQDLELTVYDNGRGIPGEKQRLRLMFGDRYGLQIKSIENYGTAVKIRIPAMTKGEMGRIVQDADCG